jgi:ribosomal protein L30E
MKKPSEGVYVQLNILPKFLGFHCNIIDFGAVCKKFELILPEIAVNDLVNPYGMLSLYPIYAATANNFSIGKITLFLHEVHYVILYQNKL